MGIQFEQSEVGNDGGNGDLGGGGANRREDAELQQHRTTSADSSSFNSVREADLTEDIGKWLRDVEKFGLINIVETNREDEDGKRLHLGHFKRKLPTFCVCDPFSGLDIQDLALDCCVEFLSDRQNRSGVVKPGDELVGEVTLAVNRRASRYILGGKWRKGFREGRGSVSGPGLEANFGVSDIVGTYRRGRLEGCCVSAIEWGEYARKLLST